MVVHLFLATRPQFGEQGLIAFLHMGGTGGVVLPLCIIKKCTIYGVDIVHFRCIWCGHSPFLLRPDQQGPQVDPHTAEIRMRQLHLIRQRAGAKCNYALCVPLQRWRGGSNQESPPSPQGCATRPTYVGPLGQHVPQKWQFLPQCWPYVQGSKQERSESFLYNGQFGGVVYVHTRLKTALVMYTNKGKNVRLMIS